MDHAIDRQRSQRTKKGLVGIAADLRGQCGCAGLAALMRREGAMNTQDLLKAIDTLAWKVDELTMVVAKKGGRKSVKILSEASAKLLTSMARINQHE
jgi:ATP-dependent 26S proteasome regulatory subunit